MKAKAILPLNFNLATHIVNYPPASYDFPEATFNTDHALWLLSQINQAPAQDKELLDQLDIHAYVPLYAKYLQGRVHAYRKYLSYFVDTHVLETDNHYIEKAKQPDNPKSIGYRFAEPYAGCMELKTVGYGQKFTRILTKKVREDYEKLKKEYHHLIKYLYPISQFTINYDLALKFAMQKRDYYLTYPERRIPVFDKKKNEYFFKDPNQQYRSAKTNLLQIQNDTLFFTVDLKGQRLHTNFTNLSKDFRNFITFKGEELVSFDIKNSQPYLITSLFNKKLYDRSKEINIFSINTKLVSFIPSEFLLTLEDFRKKFVNQDVSLYKSLVSGIDDNPLDLYLYMQEEYRVSGVHNYETRKEVKNVIYEVLFTANRYGTDIKRHFEKLFPTINQLIRLYKKKDKTLLPCLLQSIESHLVLKTITKRFAQQCPNAPIITIHDSVVTTERYAHKLKPIMEQELKEFTGLPPKLEEEKWSLNNVDWDQYKI